MPKTLTPRMVKSSYRSFSSRHLYRARNKLKKNQSVSCDRKFSKLWKMTMGKCAKFIVRNAGAYYERMKKALYGPSALLIGSAKMTSSQRIQILLQKTLLSSAGLSTWTGLSGNGRSLGCSLNVCGVGGMNAIQYMGLPLERQRHHHCPAATSHSFSKERHVLYSLFRLLVCIAPASIGSPAQRSL